MDIRDPGKIIGTNTVASMQAGLYYGSVDLVDGILLGALELGLGIFVGAVQRAGR